MLLIRAVELTDRDGLLLPQATRDRCTAEAAPPELQGGTDRGRREEITSTQEAFLAHRAALLSSELRQRVSGWPGVEAGPGGLAWLLPALLVAAFAAGLLLYRIAPDQRINLLAFPLLGLVAWNLVVYSAIAVRAFMRRARPGPGATALAGFLGRVGRLDRSPGRSGDPQSIAVGKAVSRFLQDWLPLQAPLALARAKIALHCSALLVATGAMAGLVFRGIYLEYLAGWESTFLDAGGVHAILSVVLGPATWITGIPLPDVQGVEELRFRPGFAGENAGRWIWLYAVATGLYVGLPRLLLVAVALVEERRLVRRFYRPSLRDPYLRRLLQPTRGAGEVAAIVWYGVQPDAGLRSRVRERLLDLLGGRVRLEFLDPVAYGEEASALPGLDQRDPREYLVVVFSLAATPEEEVQGEFLRTLVRHDLPGEPQAPLVLLDAEPLSRFRSDPAFRTRHDERLRSWTRFATSQGATVAVLEPQEKDGT